MNPTNNPVEKVSNRVSRVALTLAFAALVAGICLAPKRSLGQAPAGTASASAEKPKEEKKGKMGEIELPTILTGFFQNIWYHGPATATVSGVVTPNGAPIEAKSEEGQIATLAYQDEKWQGGESPRWQVNAKLEKVGDDKPTPGVKEVAATINGQQVLLLNPKLEFTWEQWFPEKIIISVWTALCIAVIGVLLTRNLQRIPGKRQVALEGFYQYLEGEIAGQIGPHYKRYVPLIITLFVYILIMNMAGLIPGWTSPTSNINVTAGLAIVVVAFVQFEGIRVNGLVGYAKHFVGEPWWLFSLNIPLHIIGEFAKILSLAIRLFGNIFGEDVVIVILIGLTGMFTGGWIPVPAVMYFFGLFTSVVQAMVFSILACAYIALMTSHEGGDHGHEEHEHDHGHGPNVLATETTVA